MFTGCMNDMKKRRGKKSATNCAHVSEPTAHFKQQLLACWISPTATDCAATASPSSSSQEPLGQLSVGS